MPRQKRRVRTILAAEDRRQQLLQAATWAFARKGYRHAGVSDIIARAGVARGTFYLYFDSKEQVFLSIVEDFHARVKRALQGLDDGAQARTPQGARAALQASFREWLGFFAAHRDATRVILKEASSIDPRFETGFAELRRSALTHFAARLRTLQHAGAVSASVDPVVVAHFQLGIFDELLNAFVLPDETADLEAIAEHLADFEWNGLKPEREQPS